MRSVVVAALLAAQDPDSTLTFGEFLRRVLATHPVARAAELTAAVGRAEARVAVGAFDPTVAVTAEQKVQGGREKFTEVKGTLTIPTPLGVDVRLGYERGTGPDVNPEASTARAGLVTAGLSIPLGQRIVTDERRTALEQARAARDAALGERAALVNRLVQAAARDFGRWWDGERRLAIATDGVALAEFRFRAVRDRVTTGDAAPIDSVEASLEVRRRAAALAEARAAAFAARTVAEAYLWDDRGAPVALPTGTVPRLDGMEGAPPDSATVAGWLATAEASHPELARAQARLDQAAAQRLLVAQQLLPAASLDLTGLAEGRSVGDLPDWDTGRQDYKAGGSVRMSALLIRERARASAAGARLEQARLDLQRLRRDVRNGVRIAATDLAAVLEQLAEQREAVRQARLLRDGEQRRFEAGDVSLLIVNLRERALLDEEQRLAQLEARLVAVRGDLVAAIGQVAVAR
jgi:outer membrane protein TolC